MINPSTQRAATIVRDDENSLTFELLSLKRLYFLYGHAEEDSEKN